MTQGPTDVPGITDMGLLEVPSSALHSSLCQHRFFPPHHVCDSICQAPLQRTGEGQASDLRPLLYFALQDIKVRNYKGHLHETQGDKNNTEANITD